ncbi:PLP-dependent aminotransferase family protein, partial [Chitinimonas sp.]|uniref:aminotransferase-like domain-containing protein n=1 Tax=Chitinimonas sp. TaxID=1934313 RepID=UPI0035B43115
WEAQPYRSPRLIYVSPAHQYPLGSVMSMPRRLALLELAAQSGAWVVEDDYDSEFRHHGESLAALQGLDRQGRVIYLGTFSKVMFPALRLAYMVLPPALVEPLIALQARLHRESDYLLQGALADFMEQGHFSRHLRRMRSIYAQRQRRLRALLSRLLACDLDNANDPSGFALLGGAAGMHVTLRLPHGLDGEAICAELALRGISVSALSAYCHAAPPFPGLVLGYGGLSDAELPQAVAMLAEVLNAARSKLAASAA